jgi:hypothetical protein
VRIYLVDSTLYAVQTGNNTSTLSTTVEIEANTWVHVAYQYQHNGTNRLFTNGALRASVTGVDCQVFGAYSLSIGSNISGSNVYKGYLDEIRIGGNPYVGLTSFTVPTSPYVYNAGDSNLVCIIHADNEGAPIPVYNDTYQGQIWSGHGGGGGEVLTINNITIQNKTYTGTVGAAGVDGSTRFSPHGATGGNTVFEGYTALGGGGATAPVDGDDPFVSIGAGLEGVGGTSGSGFVGAAYGLSTFRNNGVGGGGGGDTAVGEIPTTSSGSYFAGRGGAGVASVGGRGGDGGGQQGAWTTDTSPGRGGKGYTLNNAYPAYPASPGAVSITVVAK